jgi:type III secretion protein T
MENTFLFDLLTDKVLLLAISTLRLAVALLVVPIFSDEIIPPLIRNSLFISIAIVVVYLQPDFDLNTLTVTDWLSLVAKELFIGLVLGFFFGLFLWAFEAAGTIIDTQIGASMAMVYDPISGHEITLFGEFLGRWANFLFIAAGGLLFLSVAILKSYAIWPAFEPIPNLQQATLDFFRFEFSRFIKLILMIASPVIIVVFMVDLCMGIINRFAKRMDIIFISLALKGLAALLLLIILVPTMVDILMTQLDLHRNGLDDFARRIIGGNP